MREAHMTAFEFFEILNSIYFICFKAAYSVTMNIFRKFLFSF